MKYLSPLLKQTVNYFLIMVCLTNPLYDKGGESYTIKHIWFYT